jgi:aryl-alcohol dehydrogenase-like predicted oxidoreductase
MEKRKLGNTLIEVAPLAFGGNVFGFTIDEQTSFRLLDAFVDEYSFYKCAGTISCYKI